MSYEIRGNILGFEDTLKVDITEIDDLFSTMQDANNENISFTIVNPYALRKYEFDLPSDIKVLLNINENSNVSIYNIVIIGQPIENSTINFLAPIIVNNDNKKIAQAVIDSKKYPQYGIEENIKSFKR